MLIHGAAPKGWISLDCKTVSTNFMCVVDFTSWFSFRWVLKLILINLLWDIYKCILITFMLPLLPPTPPSHHFVSFFFSLEDFFFLFERGLTLTSVYHRGWPRTSDPPTPTSWVLWLHACATMSGLCGTEDAFTSSSIEGRGPGW